jgi:hypothetical protein
LASTSAYDFWAPRHPRAGDDALLAIGRRFSLVWAALLIVAAIAFIPLSRNGTAVEVSLGIASIVYGGLLGVFALARFVPGAGPGAARAGLVGGILAVLALWVFGRTVVAWPWFVFLGTLICLAVGLLWSRASAQVARGG